MLSGENPEHLLPSLAPFCAKSGKGMADRPRRSARSCGRQRARGGQDARRTPRNSFDGCRTRIASDARTSTSRRVRWCSCTTQTCPHRPQRDRSAVATNGWSAGTRYQRRVRAVTILDKDGNFHFMNGFGRPARLALNGAIGGRNQSEFLTGAAHEARVSLIQRASGRESLAVSRHVAGLFRRTVYRASPFARKERAHRLRRLQPVTIDDLTGQSQVYCETCLDLDPSPNSPSENSRSPADRRALDARSPNASTARGRPSSGTACHWAPNSTPPTASNSPACHAGITWFDEDSIGHVWRRAAQANGNHRVQHAD